MTLSLISSLFSYYLDFIRNFITWIFNSSCILLPSITYWMIFFSCFSMASFFSTLQTAPFDLSATWSKCVIFSSITLDHSFRLLARLRVFTLSVTVVCVCLYLCMYNVYMQRYTDWCIQVGIAKNCRR